MGHDTHSQIPQLLTRHFPFLSTLVGVTIDKGTVRKQPEYHCSKDVLQSAYSLKCPLCSCPIWFGFQAEYLKWQCY